MLRNISKVVLTQKAKFGTAAPAPHTKPEILYTGVSKAQLFRAIYLIMSMDTCRKLIHHAISL